MTAATELQRGISVIKERHERVDVVLEQYPNYRRRAVGDDHMYDAHNDRATLLTKLTDAQVVIVGLREERDRIAQSMEVSDFAHETSCGHLGALIDELRAERDQLCETWELAKPQLDRLSGLETERTALRARVADLQNQVALWQTSCCGKHGSQAPCVSVNASPPFGIKPSSQRGEATPQVCFHCESRPARVKDGLCEQCLDKLGNKV